MVKRKIVMKKKSKIFVIIITYKGKHWYDKCFSSLRESTIPLQTIVVDNTPGDEDAKYIKDRFPEVYVIKTNENLGFGKANNLGMRYAMDNGCDYVFLLNQDAWIEKDSITKLVEIAEQHPEYGIISPMQMNAGMNQINMMYYDKNNNNDLTSDLYCSKLKNIYPVNYVNAAAWLLPRKTLETIGGFCPMIHMYGEDDDYLNRAAYHHIGVGICPSARIVHDTVIKLEESKLNSRRANETALYQYLDINKNLDFNKILLHFFAKIIINAIKFNKDKFTYYKHQYSYLRKHKGEIEDSRFQHKLKKSNWLN